MHDPASSGHNHNTFYVLCAQSREITVGMAAMSFQRICYLTSLLVMSAYIYSSSLNEKGLWGVNENIGPLSVKVIKRGLSETMQLPLFASIGLVSSPFIANVGATTYAPVLPPSYPLAVRSPYLSGIHFAQSPVLDL